MRAEEIEALPVVKEASAVLMGLEERGLVEPAIASGWTRALLTDTTLSDIDIAYVGPVHYEEAQEHLRAVLAELALHPDPWDIEGIWNAEMADGLKHTAENYLIHYVSSIDSVYLAADGRLHDPTGYGLQDAEARVLRINNYDRRQGRETSASEEVYICLEGCRRVAQLRWSITPESKQRIAEGIVRWGELTGEEKERLVKRLSKKFAPQDREAAQKTYHQFGWGFVFDYLD